MTEAELLGWVLEHIQQRQLLYHHCPDSRRCQGQSGFPDLFIAGPHGAILAELKTATGESSAEQDLWHWIIDRGRGGSPCPWHLWRPEHLADGTIERVLDTIA
jgi:hypothetical protein